MKINRSSFAGILASGVAVVALTTGGVAAAGSPAVAADRTQTTQIVQTAQSRQGGAPDDMHGMHSMHGMFERMLHGEFVLAKPGGGRQTVLIQRGAVQSVSTDNISLRSSDGFKGTYTVGADATVNAGRNGLGSIKDGAQVVVVATGSMQNATAVHVFDVSLMKSHHGMGQMPR
ncbi:hypothetical protein SAMN05421678_117106 [Actinopolymorpha cephalotaxi]|uniref:DUF5666 domain-containing protein n=1 Tax=Actinopolymorpha cephalotaxi TaxID=504797 RepID=A0A1I2ZYK3_9ACTN|nr:hypothetical protein [Actinopolymorpha cephalotaxi]NYH84206.1 hypothetical protein [Actinopolymorpha cephalotaxi]SFH42111.1 hypothetical protein SAMN05421678_117106 [Actinopolymorpha cephalotaxi]